MVITLTHSSQIVLKNTNIPVLKSHQGMQEFVFL